MAPCSPSRSHSRSVSRSRSKSCSRRRSPSRSRSRSRSKSRSRSPANRRRSYTRSKSRSRSRAGSPNKSRSRSRSPWSSRKRHVGDREAPPPGKCLGVFGLSFYTTERDVRDLFERYAKVDDCKIVYDRATGRSRGFAFVNMVTVAGAEDIKERLNGEELDGRRIRVDYSITQRPHTPTPGMYMGRPTYSNRSGGYNGGRGNARNNRGGRYGSNRRSFSRSRSRSRSPRYRDRY